MHAYSNMETQVNLNVPKLMPRTVSQLRQSKQGQQYVLADSHLKRDNAVTLVT